MRWWVRTAWRSKCLVLASWTCSGFLRRRLASPCAGTGPPADVAWKQFVIDAWGPAVLGEMVSPDVALHDPRFGPWFAKNQRMYMTPSAASRVVTQSVDIRDALRLVRLPTLVLHRENF